MTLHRRPISFEKSNLTVLSLRVAKHPDFSYQSREPKAYTALGM
jgi:hypothetical protein